MGTEAAQDLLAGRQFLYIGNSVLRQDMYATLHVALGKGVDTPIDDMRGAGLHTAAMLIVDLTNRTIHKFTPSSLPLCRVPPHCNSYFTGDINLATDNGPTTYGASWHVSWPAAEQHANLNAQLAGTFPSSPRWTELLQGSPAPVLRMRVGPDGRSFVQAFLLARRPVALASSNLTAELSEWARRGCVAAGCRLQTRQVFVAKVQGNTGFRPSTLQCPGRFQDAVQRAVASVVPAGHRWSVLSFIFTFMGAEGAVAMHRCEHHNDRSWGHGADLVVVSSHLTDDFMVLLLQRRRAVQNNNCFRDNSSASSTSARSRSTVLVRPALWRVRAQATVGGMEGQAARQAAQQSADERLGATHGTLFLDDASAVGLAVSDPATGIGRPDGVHFNDTGRRFITQLTLNWMRQWQRGERAAQSI